MKQQRKNQTREPARSGNKRGRPARAVADTDPAHIDAHINRYRALGAPQLVREKVTAFSRTAVAEACPESVDTARRALSHVAGLAAWALRVGLPLEVADLLRPDTIERYATAVRHGGGARSVRPVLRRVGERVNPCAFPAASPPLARARVAAPYSEAQIAAFLALADAQPTQLRRMRLKALICLGAGAGLTAADILPLRGPNLVMNAGMMTVSVQGRSSRVVPIDPAFHTPLIEVMAWASGGRLFTSDSPRFIGNLTAQVAGGADLPRLSLQRLRNTWLAWQLRAIGFRELLVAADITRSPVIFDLAAQEPAPSAEQVIAALNRRPACS